MLGSKPAPKLQLFSNKPITKKGSRKTLLRAIAIVLLSLLIGWIMAWRDVDVSQQEALMSHLLTVAAVVFGILGVWISILDPSLVLNRKPTETLDERAQLALEYSPLLITATFVFAALIVLRLVSPLFPAVWLSSSWGTFVMGTIIGGLYIIEVGVLLLTLLPLARAHRKIRQDRVRREHRH